MISGASGLTFLSYSLGSIVSCSKIGSSLFVISVYKTLQLSGDAFQSLLGDILLFLTISSFLRENISLFKIIFC